jgi:RNA polymerase sigma-70 factor (ECF subfamily)
MPESTATLISRVKAGDSSARDQLIARFLPLLNRWAHGRLPAHARGLMETGDLVQLTVVRTMNRLETLKSQREGALVAYLRRTLLNLLRNEIRRSVHERNRAASGQANPELLPDRRPSLLEEMIDQEALDLYEKCLAALPKMLQEAIILSVEFGYTHQELAEAIGSPSPNAARMTVARGLARLSKAMDECR